MMCEIKCLIPYLCVRLRFKASSSSSVVSNQERNVLDINNCGENVTLYLDGRGQILCSIFEPIIMSLATFRAVSSCLVVFDKI